MELTCALAVGRLEVCDARLDVGPVLGDHGAHDLQHAAHVGGSIAEAGREVGHAAPGRVGDAAEGVTDLVVRVGREATADQVNEVFRPAAAGPLAAYLPSTEDQLVSSDIQHSPYSCIFDSELTMANGSMVKVFGWYDNEWGYSCRLVDMIGKLLP